MAGTIERTLALKLVGDVSGIRKDLKPATRQFGKLTKSALSWGKALGGAALLGAVQGVGDALGEAYKGFKSGERIAKQLGKTWQNLGKDGDRLDHWIERISDNTLKLGTSDDDAIASFNRLLQTTGNAADAYRRYSIAQDLVSNGSAPNLAAAEKIIQQAAKGSARVVDRFGLSSKTAAGRVNELADRVKGAAKTAARAEPFRVLINGLSEDLESIVGAFSKGDFKGFIKGIQGLGDTISDALFGGKGKDGERNSKTAGLVNQFGAWGKKMADGILKGIGEVDWGKSLSDTVNTALGAIDEAARNGTLTNLAAVGATILGAIFAADLAVTAMTTLFSVPKLMVKGVISAITTVGVSIAGTMFGAQKVTDAAGTAIAGTISTAANGKAVGAAAAGAGLSIGGIIAAGIGSLIAAAIVGGLTLATQEANRIPISLLADAKRARGHGASIDSARATLRRSFPGATDAQIQQALWEAGYGHGFGSHAPRKRGRTGFASGTAGAPPGWSWVGERGPELMRMRGGEQVMNSQASMRAAGGGDATVVNLYVSVPPTADQAAIGQTIMRAIDAALGRGARFRYAVKGGTQ